MADMNAGDDVQQTDRHLTLDLGVVMERRPGVMRWERWSWRAAGVLLHALDADWTPLHRCEAAALFHATTLPLELHAAETDAYAHNLGARVPSVYVLLRPCGGVRSPKAVRVTASPFEAQDYAGNGEDAIERIAMPDALLRFVQDFVTRHHREVPFVKRRRDRAGSGRTHGGLGDERIGSGGDVYRAPTSHAGMR